MRINKIIASFIVLVLSSLSCAQTVQESIKSLQGQWAVNNYQLTGKVQKEAFIELMAQADEQLLMYPQSAELYIWRGIIQSTYAGVNGGLGALKYAKAAKADLEKALSLNAMALQGSAYTSLGTLYFNVPGWPIGFGDDGKAEELLTKALAINPEGIDPNYFYGDFLQSEKRYNEAKAYMEKALKAAPRVGRELADNGRKKEIRQALLAIEQHL
jgi:tetratricopeptide (TPR) repeat protein